MVTNLCPVYFSSPDTLHLHHEHTTPPVHSVPSFCSRRTTANQRICFLLTQLSNRKHSPYRSPVKDLYIAYNTLPIPQLHIQQLLLLVHKCIYHKSMLPHIFLDYFHENQTIYSHHTRQNTIFICIVFTQLLVKGLLNSMVPHYGMSSLNTSKISSLLKKFKELLKLHLLS